MTFEEMVALLASPIGEKHTKALDEIDRQIKEAEANVQRLNGQLELEVGRLNVLQSIYKLMNGGQVDTQSLSPVTHPAKRTRNPETEKPAGYLVGTKNGGYLVNEKYADSPFAQALLKSGKAQVKARKYNTTAPKLTPEQLAEWWNKEDEPSIPRAKAHFGKDPSTAYNKAREMKLLNKYREKDSRSYIIVSSR